MRAYFVFCSEGQTLSSSGLLGFVAYAMDTRDKGKVTVDDVLIVQE